MKSVLGTNSPWHVAKCGDPDCFPCSTAVGPLKISCRTPGAVYSIVCLLCQGKGTDAVYYGETGKNCYSRGKKHLEDFAAKLSSHCMTIHAKKHHPDVTTVASNFRMIPLKLIRKPLDRQITEALEIANSSVDILFNSGTEWRFGQIPRTAVTSPV